jgi:diaminopimelate epimerase
MTIPFYKLQLAGNGFILVDVDAFGASADQADRLTPDRYAAASRQLCDRRFGVGATGAIFLTRDNTIRIFNAQGQSSSDADDAYLCAARYAFDSGRISGKRIVFSAPRGKRELAILGAHEFRLNTGSPFSLLGGHVIDSASGKHVEYLDRDGIRIACSAIHIHDDVVVAFPQSLGILNYASFAALVQKAFPAKNVLPVIAKAITADTLLVRAHVKQESGSCAAAAAALVAGVCEGSSEREAIVMFDYGGADGQPDAVMAKDRDNSRRLAVSWDTGANELFVIGSGGYLFEGKIDFQDGKAT